MDFLIYQEHDPDDDLFDSLHSFITRQVTRVRNQLAGGNSIDDETANLCFYMARNIIRRNEDVLQDDLLFLLDLLKNNEIAHKNNNELLRLAITQNNQHAVNSLNLIEPVRILSEQNKFYVNYEEPLDLRRIAQDDESSMHMLTDQERKCLAGVTARYEPIIAEFGLDKLFRDLCENLKRRYLDRPAQIIINDKSLSLPVMLQDLPSLIENFSLEERKYVIKTYIKDKNHTALRFLSKPNLLLSLNAEYVYSDLKNSNHKCSHFEHYSARNKRLCAGMLSKKYYKPK